MKRLFLILGTSLCLCAVNKTMAQYFSVENKDNIPIHYIVTSHIYPLTVAVVSDTNLNNSYSGDITIPSDIMHDNYTYSVTSIGYSAFSSCKSLTSVIIPNSVIQLEEYVFAECSNLTSVTLPNTLINMGHYAFSGCHSLTSIIIPNTLTEIRDNTFSGCSSLTSIIIPSSVITIGSRAFENCTGLTSIIIPDSVTMICDNTFYGCSSLTSVTIPDAVTDILYGAFYGCSSLTSITLPDSVEIKDDVFFDCIGLKEIYVRAINPPQMTSTTFTNVPDTIPVYVPCETADDYRNDPNWGIFTNIIDTFTLYNIGVQSEAAVMGTADITKKNTCSDNTATIMATANTGFRFLKWNDENTDNPRIITVVSDTTLTAIFEITYNVNVLANDDTWGILIGSNSYPKDSMATIEAIPNTGYRFFRWDDGNIDNPRTITVVSDTDFRAIFEIMYNVKVLANYDTMGTLIGEKNYPKDSMAIIKAIPNTGYRFFKWDDGNTDNPRTITVVSDTNFKAIFEIMHNVNVLVNDTWGTIIGEKNYPKDSMATISAIPKAGYRFFKWDDENTDNPRTIIIVSDTVFTAIFEIMYNVHVLSNDNTMGTVIGGKTYPKDSMTIVGAIPKTGYRFLKWSDGNIDNPRTITVTQDIILTAIFDMMYNVNVSANDNTIGTVSGSGFYPKDSTATINAIPKAGYRFLKWNDGNTDNPRTIIVTSEMSFIAEFEILYHVEVLPNNNDRGFVSGTGDYPENTTIAFGAIANQGYHFTHWNDGNTDNPRTITVVQNTTFIATFDVSTDIKEMETSDISVYPNPVRDNINIHLPDNVYQAVFTLYDIRGKVLIRKEIRNQDAISVSNLAAGIYIYNVRIEKQNYMGKIIKQ
jgi:hypothetical protein